jgi:LDH2 family malate/lactate/ureidoglycolate dehydrogenase
LSVIVQALGILGGSDPIVGEDGKWGYFFMAFDPSLLMPLADFKKNISSMRHSIENSRPTPGGSAVRVPGSAGTRNVEEGRARGWIELDHVIYQALQ